MVQVANPPSPRGSKKFYLLQTRSYRVWHPLSLLNSVHRGSFLGGGGVEAANHPLLAPRLKMVRATPPSPLCACIGMSARLTLIKNFSIKWYLCNEFSQRNLAGRFNASDLYSVCALFESQPGRRPAILTETSSICLPVENNSRRELHILHYWSILHAWRH